MAFFGLGGAGFSFGHEEITHGGKIIMPPSALEKLARLNISYPMLFKLSNTKKNTKTHCGVLEFVAEEGRIYVPLWMMSQLLIEDGEILTIQNVSLSLATYSKFQPQSVDFLDIHNPKAVLESKLRSFACLTKGDVIGIEYNTKVYELLVVDTQPKEAVSIIECDMKVDFSAPVGYKPPDPVQSMESDVVDTLEEGERDAAIKEAVEKINNFTAFSGGGQRLDGKANKSIITSIDPSIVSIKRGYPNYNYKKGKLNFVKLKSLTAGEPMEEEDSSFVAFSGEGEKLRIKRKK